MGFLANLGIGGFLNLLNSLLPLIQVGIHVAEASGNTGAQKYQQVLDGVMTVAGKAPAIIAAVQKSGTAINDAAHAGDIATLTAGVGSLINVAVATANSVGAFQKSGFIQAVTAAQQQGDTSGGA